MGNGGSVWRLEPKGPTHRHRTGASARPTAPAPARAHGLRARGRVFRAAAAAAVGRGGGGSGAAGMVGIDRSSGGETGCPLAQGVVAAAVSVVDGPLLPGRPVRSASPCQPWPIRNMRARNPRTSQSCFIDVAPVARLEGKYNLSKRNEIASCVPQTGRRARSAFHRVSAHRDVLGPTRRSAPSCDRGHKMCYREGRTGWKPSADPAARAAAGRRQDDIRRRTTTRSRSSSWYWGC